MAIDAENVGRFEGSLQCFAVSLDSDSSLVPQISLNILLKHATELGFSASSVSALRAICQSSIRGARS